MIQTQSKRKYIYDIITLERSEQALQFYVETYIITAVVLIPLAITVSSAIWLPQSTI